MTAINGAEWRGRIDLLVGGTPCQAFSVAGQRRSLDDARGNLTLRFVDLADAIDPAFILWENVSGVLSTRDNAFGCFLGGLAGEDGPLVAPGGRWTDAGVVSGPARTVAWRVLDAQYFGLAQRRRRVFVVAGARGRADPTPILFERDGLRRDSPPCREAEQGVAGSLADGSRRHGCSSSDDLPLAFGGNNTSGSIDISTALNACASASGRIDFETETFVLQSAVRRLTPTERERLQGFPDHYTRIPWRRKAAADCPDGPRYRVLGNSMAVPVMRWIGRRIEAYVEQKHSPLGRRPIAVLDEAAEHLRGEIALIEYEVTMPNGRACRGCARADRARLSNNESDT
jgi:site-specific DNA-cytosine methylase